MEYKQENEIINPYWEEKFKGAIEGLNWSNKSKEELESKISHKNEMVLKVIEYFYPCAKISSEILEPIQYEIDENNNFFGASKYIIHFDEDCKVMEILVRNHTTSKITLTFNAFKIFRRNIYLNNIQNFIYLMMELKWDFEEKIPKNNIAEEILNKVKLI